MAEPDVQQKKRKRTGKEREERKRAAIAAKAAAEAEAAASGVSPSEAVVADEAVAPLPEGESAPVEGKEEKEGVDFEVLAKRIPAGLKKLHPVFKAAKKAETMRLIKKIRFMKTKEQDVSELEAQLTLLRAVELHALATSHLALKLRKHHLLKHTTLPDNVLAVLPVSPSVPASSSSATPDVIGKVENRLCSSKGVADAIKPVVAWVLNEKEAKLVTKPIVRGSGKKGGKKADSSDSEDEDEEDDEDEDGLVAGPVQGLESDDEVVLEDKAADAAGWESGSVGGDSDSDEEDGSDGEDGDIGIASGSESEDERPAAKKAKAMALKEALKAKPAPPAKKESKTKEKAGTSMFLPSLAAGFAAGDGDSDPDMDEDEHGIIGKKSVQRKNRRGQRARQAIWEKKYGSGAKHVIKRKEEEEKRVRGPQGQKRDGGWGQRRGAGDSASSAAATSSTSAPVPSAPAPTPGPAARSRPSGPPAGAPKPGSKESLHPSWEAARLRKAREAAAGAPKATKIVFD